MVAVQCVGWDAANLKYIRGGWYLRYELEQLLDQPLNIWITSLFQKVCQQQGKEPHTLDNIIVMVLRHHSPKFGFAFREPFLRNGKGIGKGIPDMKVGYSGNLIEFQKTLIHEALHLLNFDEESVEKRTQLIYKKLKNA